jgi:hypothetical protein
MTDIEKIEELERKIIDEKKAKDKADLTSYAMLELITRGLSPGLAKFINAKDKTDMVAAINSLDRSVHNEVRKKR